MEEIAALEKQRTRSCDAGVEKKAAAG